MKRYIHMEENDDETITITINLGDDIEEMTALFPMSFYDLMSMFVASEEHLELAAQIGMSAIMIPNEINDEEIYE